MESKLMLEVVELTDGGALTPRGRAVLRNKISQLEAAVSKETQITCPLTHRFSKGVYAREIFIPKGSLIVGAIHKFQNMNVISKGDVSFFSVDGAVRVQAPHTFSASPGVKRVIYAHEDTVWTTIHGTEETDLGKIEEIFIAKNYAEVSGISDLELKLIEEVQNELDDSGYGRIGSGSGSTTEKSATASQSATS